MRIKLFKLLLVAVLTSFPLNVFALFGNNSTGGMSEIYLDNTRIKVNGGFIDGYEENSISVTGKGIDLSLTVDNSGSKDNRNISILISNINPNISKIVGLADGKVKKGVNSLSFDATVKAKKLEVYKVGHNFPQEGYKFIVFGESKGGEHVLKRILGDINYRKPLFAVSLGDMIEKADPDEFEDFIDEKAATAVPFLTVPGVAEIDGGSRKLYENYLGQPYYSFDFKNAHFVFLDNADGTMSENQFIWLKNDLMQSKAVHTFVFAHLPPFDPRPGRPEPMGVGKQYKRLTAIFEKYNVSRVFTGGIHGYFREVRGGIPYIITGGGGSELESPDSFYNYIIVNVDGDKVKDKLIKLTMPPLGLYDSVVFKVKHFIKDSFEVHPVKSTIYVIVILIVLYFILRGLIQLFFVSSKRRGRL